MMFDDLIKDNNIQITEPEAAFIKSLIIGEPLSTMLVSPIWKVLRAT